MATWQSPLRHDVAPMTTSDHYRPEIDGLRALAVVPVILFHAGFDAFAGGFVGVDIFFVISGYLITNIILRDIRDERFSLGNFYERRARRILPALLLVCLVSIPFAFFWMLPLDLENFSQSLIAVNLFISNIHFWREAGYFATATELEPLIHTWTLAVEEQFYIVFPLLLWALRKQSSRRLTIMVGALTLASFALADFLSERAPAANFYLLPSRAWELGVGALAAIRFRERHSAPTVVSSILAIAGIALIVLAVVMVNEDYPYPGRWTLLPVLGTVLVITYAGRADIVGRWLAWRPLVGVGLVSYSAYLWHQPLFAFARLRSPTDLTTTDYLAIILATFILAWLTWLCVEMPFRNRQLMPLKRVATMLAPAAVACLVFGIVANAGLPGRENGRLASISREIWDWPDVGPCLDRGGIKLCGELDEPTVIIWGDSFAEHLEAGIRQNEPSALLVKAIKYACGPALGLAYLQSRAYTQAWARDCIRHNSEVARYIEVTPSIRYAVLSLNLTNYTKNELFVQGEARKSDLEALADRMASTLEWLNQRGIQAVLIGPPPANGSDFGRCLAESRLFHSPTTVCDFERPRHANEEAVLRLIAARGHTVLRIEDAICDEERCRSSIGSTMIYRDDGHLTWGGSHLIGEKLRFFRW